ncbi:hypothetical protein Q3G72_012249 [Acer saccharum]|nr:hypothetical protein Q3G72_012249 [Acer saccharum]
MPTHAASPPITNHANHEISNLNGNLVLDSSDAIQDVTHASNLNNSIDETESTKSAHTSSMQNDVEPIQIKEPEVNSHDLSNSPTVKEISNQFSNQFPSS